MALPDFITEKTTIWDFLKNDSQPIVLYGMGNGADIVISQLEKIGRRPSEIMASDAFVRGQLFHGFKVKKLSQIEAEYGEKDFTVLVCFGTQLDEVIENIKRVSQRHRTFAAYVPVFGNNIMTSDFLENSIEDITKARKLFCDPVSVKTFDCCINFYIFGRLSYLFDCEAPKDESFSQLIKLSHEESYLDLGAYRGDTIEEFLHYSKGGFKKITALEPDRKTFLKLVQNTQSLQQEKLLLLNKGVWSCQDKLYFENRCARGSALSGEARGKRSVETEVTSVDLLDEEGEFTYIKADVEGAEEELIKGAQRTIKKGMAKLSIAVYHRTEDIFKIPLLINSINPNYRFFLRHHRYVPFWDTNLYCVPDSR